MFLVSENGTISNKKATLSRKAISQATKSRNWWTPFVTMSSSKKKAKLARLWQSCAPALSMKCQSHLKEPGQKLLSVYRIDLCRVATMCVDVSSIRTITMAAGPRTRSKWCRTWFLFMAKLGKLSLKKWSKWVDEVALQAISRTNSNRWARTVRANATWVLGR